MAAAAPNPWVAIDVSTDPVAHARLLGRVHERELVDESTPSSHVRELVLNSWRRSLAAGVAPDQVGAPLRLTGSELEEARARSPLAPVIDVIRSTVSSLDGDARHIVAIGDASANLLWVSGDPGAVERAREMHFQEGAAWSELEAGTNAVGTAAALDHPVQIFSAEHVVAAVHPWTCSAAPIHDPATGELIGVVDLTAPLRTNHPHTLSLALLAARAAEAALYRRSLDMAARARLQLLGHDANVRLAAGRRERGLRSLELLAVLAMHPEGMTTEQLALALYGERGKPATIRAQVHRVRTYLGATAVETHPYRLAIPFDADWLEVRRLVAAGRPREALQVYRGPLLPASDAPEIVEARSLLEESLRRAILTTADPELLSRWLAQPAGADDLAAARALVAVLPSGGPRRAAATATAAAIARRMAPAGV